MVHSILLKDTTRLPIQTGIRPTHLVPCILVVWQNILRRTMHTCIGAGRVRSLARSWITRLAHHLEQIRGPREHWQIRHRNMIVHCVRAGLLLCHVNGPASAEAPSPHLSIPLHLPYSEVPQWLKRLSLAIPRVV